MTLIIAFILLAHVDADWLAYVSVLSIWLFHLNFYWRRPNDK